jgi:hypothetical protein
MEQDFTVRIELVREQICYACLVLIGSGKIVHKMNKNIVLPFSYASLPLTCRTFHALNVEVYNWHLTRTIVRLEFFQINLEWSRLFHNFFAFSV